jgi:hypothetical protein
MGCTELGCIDTNTLERLKFLRTCLESVDESAQMCPRWVPKVLKSLLDCLKST